MRSRANTRGLRSFGAAAVVGALAFSLAACAPEQAPEETGPIHLQLLFPVAASGPLPETMAKLADDFNASQEGITVEPIYSGSYQDTMTKARAMFDANEAPDLLIASSAELFNLLDLDMITAYDDILDAGQLGWIDKFYPALMVNSQFDGKTYGAPFQRSTIIQYINMDALEAAGIDRNFVPTTWQELQDTAVKMTNAAGSTEYGLEIPTTAFGDWLFAALAWQNGHELVNEQGTETYFDHPKALEALKFWLNLGEVGATPKGSVAWATTPKDFIEGKAGIIWTTSGNLANIKDQVSFELNVSPLPAGVQAGSPTGGANLYVFKTDDERKQKAAAQFVEWITNADRSAEWSIATGYVASSDAAYEDPAMVAYAADFPAAYVARDQLQDFTRALGLHGNSRANAALTEAIEAALAGTKTPEQALKDAQATADQVLARYR